MKKIAVTFLAIAFSISVQGQRVVKTDYTVEYSMTTGKVTHEKASKCLFKVAGGYLSFYSQDLKIDWRNKKIIKMESLGEMRYSIKIEGAEFLVYIKDDLIFLKQAGVKYFYQFYISE